MIENSHILVVDDNQENLRVVSTYLRKNGYKIALALDGPSALNITETDNINLILLDIMMPAMDGFEVCKRLKDNPETAAIPVIFLTAKNETEDIVNGFKLGGVDFITKPFKKDELLARVKNHLELEAARKKIEELNRSRDKLYSIIAHDIRSPLASISQTINVILDGFIDVNSDDFNTLFQQLSDRTEDTLTLLNNLLDWTRNKNGQIEVVPCKVQLDKMILECVNLLQPVAQAKNIQIKNNITESNTVYCDEKSMQTVFRNILSNAIKFTPENGEIILSAVLNNNFMEVAFSDSGIGMEQEVINKILIRKEHHTTRGTENEKGTGLGLQMALDFIDLNKGSLDVTSQPGKGTTFTIKIPVKD